MTKRLCDFTATGRQGEYRCERCRFLAVNVRLLPIYRNCPGPRGIGDLIEAWLKRWGVVHGQSCGCQKRQLWLNRQRWLSRLFGLR